MAAVERLPEHKHFVHRVLGVDTVTFLQNYYHVPHVAVHEVNP